MIPPNNGDSSLFHGGGSSTATLEAPRGSGTLVPVGSNLPADPMADWGDPGVSFGQERASHGVDPFEFVHALRRRWLLATVVALAIGVTVLLVMWLVLPAEYRAVALLQVKGSPQAFVSKDVRSPAESEVVRFQETQRALAKSLRVVQAALRDPKINTLSTIKAEKNPERYLLEEVQVAFVNKSDIMAVSLKSTEPNEAKEIVKAVVASYISEIVYSEEKEKDNNIVKLTGLLEAKKQELDKARAAYQTLIKQLEAYDTDSYKVKLEMEMRKLGELAHQLAQAEADGRRAYSEFTDAKLEADSMGKISRDKHAVKRMLETNGEYRQLVSDFRKLNSAREIAISTTGVADPELDLQITQVAKQMKQVEKEFSENISKSGNDAFSQAKLQRLQAKVQMKQHEIADLRKKHETLQATLERNTGSADQLINNKTRIAELTQESQRMSDTLSQWNLEKYAAKRVEIVQPAEIPPDTDLTRWMVIIGASVVATCISGLGIAVWEFSRRKISTVHDVTGKLRLGVVGTLPKLTHQGLIGRMSPTELEAALTDSVDSLRTALIHGVGSGRQGSVMVTSAGDGEGKTTVASQLAVSLARCGRRTLLIDADLRSPALHQLFELPLDSGLSEVLRGEVDIEDALRPTPAPGLKFLSAGQCNHASIQALENENLGRVFDRLKGQFDFIVVDTAPVLAFADSLLIGQHLDGAILSVRLDISQRHKIEEAVNRMKTVGVLMLGAVVNGARPQRSHRGGDQSPTSDAA